MSSFNTQMRDYADWIEKKLDSYFVDLAQTEHRALLEAMRYSLLGGGKRIRGVLTLAFYRLFHEDVTPALPFAAAVEMVHAYSLIHDDLPCMDDDDMRRAKPSCHIAFGEATALLAGDGLLTLSFQAISRADTLLAQNCLQAVRLLSESAGMHGMIAGQMLDMQGEGKTLSAEQLDKINENKTGMLISCAARLGCIAADAQAMERIAWEYGMRIGRAFQIMDDVLDVTSDSSVLGKPVGSDRENQKNTYAALWGVERCRETVRELTEQAKDLLKKTDLDVEFLCVLADMLGERRY